MDRSFYLNLAKQGLSMPIGADLVLHGEPAPAAILRDGTALGRVVEKTARRFQTPLAIPLMDLQLEKATLLRGLDIPVADVATYHFEEPPTDAQMATLRRRVREPLSPQQQVHVDAVASVARHAPDLVPCGMMIGPFSLMTKLLKDPITPVYLSGMGVTAAEDPAVAAVERTLELAMLMVERSLRAQLAVGARLICVAEPAANRVYVSPKQIEEGSDVYERMVMKNLRRLKAIMDEAFGRANFVADIAWEKRTTRENRRVFSFKHDHLFVFANQKARFEQTRNQLPLSERVKARYKNPDDDPRGPWQSISANAQAGHATPSQFYTLVAPNGTQHVPPTGRCWLYTKERMENAVQEGNIWFGKNGSEGPIMQKLCHPERAQRVEGPAFVFRQVGRKRREAGVLTPAQRPRKIAGFSPGGRFIGELAD